MILSSDILNDIRLYYIIVRNTKSRQLGIIKTLAQTYNVLLFKFTETARCRSSFLKRELLYCFEFEITNLMR